MTSQKKKAGNYDITIVTAEDDKLNKQIHNLQEQNSGLQEKIDKLQNENSDLVKALQETNSESFAHLAGSIKLMDEVGNLTQQLDAPQR